MKVHDYANPSLHLTEPNTFTTMFNSAEFRIVHPLDDAPEAKLFSLASSGQMAMSPTVKWSLIVLRTYLILITGLVLFRVAQLSVMHH